MLLKQFKEGWNAYSTWPGSDLTKLWDIVRNVIDGKTKAKQSFVVDALKSEKIQDAILNNEELHKTLADKIAVRLYGDIKLAKMDNPVVRMLLEVVSPKAVANMQHLFDIVRLGLHDEVQQMNVATQIAKRSMEYVKEKVAHQILVLLGQRGDAAKDETELFEMMKNVAAAYAEKLKEELPECFSEKPMVPENEDEKVDEEGNKEEKKGNE